MARASEGLSNGRRIGFDACVRRMKLQIAAAVCRFRLNDQQVVLNRTRPCLSDKLIKIGANLVSHSRHVTLRVVEVAIHHEMFAEVLRLVAELQLQPPPAPAPA